MKREDIRIRDPFVFTENNKYYLLGTTGNDPWGKGSDLTLYVSYDLQTFEKVCVLVSDGSLDSYSNIWAPELHKYNGNYYLIVSAYRADVGRGSFIFVSDSLDDNFKMLTGEYITPKGWGCLDATLFVYEHKPYLCFSNEWTTPITRDGNGSLFMAKLSDDLTEIIGEPQKVIGGKESGVAVEIQIDAKKGYVAEGPYMYMENENIVLLWSTFTSNGYSVMKNVSCNGIFGTYAFERVVFDSNGGHCMSFNDLHGKRQLILHQPNIEYKERMHIFALDAM